jgi:phage pi2 protein 07
MEYMDPLDLMDCLSSTEIGLCWYPKETNAKWTYNLMNHLMIDLETRIALASMTYVVDLNAYELHPGMKKSLTIYR